MTGFAYPWFLLLLGLPLLLRFLLPCCKLKPGAALRLPFYQYMQTSLNQNKLYKSRHFIFFSLIWCLAIFALADPRWVGEPEPLPQEGRNLMMVLDLSGSMALQDMLWQGQAVSRLSVVKHTAKEFVRARKGDRVGLVLFGSQAYLQTPMTFDRQNVLMRIDDASVGLAGKTTSIGDALGFAVKKMRNLPERSKVIVFLTDGVNNSGVLLPKKAAEIAAQNHIRVYTIGLGSDFSSHAGADLDEQTLEDMAKITGGQYFRATDPGSLSRVYEVIHQLEPVDGADKTVRPQKSLYPWPLALAFLFLMTWLLNKALLLRRKR